MTTDHPQRPGRPATSTTGTRSARVLTAGATLDAAAAAELRREVRALLAGSADPLVVDLTAVRVADRAIAADVLRDLAYEAGDADVDLRVVRRTVRDPRARDVRRDLLGDESLFEVYPDLDAALDGASGER